ncbi:hypothetical protein [Occultella kanbiaonis]|uniref:hypothetical protein n=1 Tax=Occultella kanbiaonis TaxID=2675754 RepID=UPI0013D248CC|nr:hypothetical protein [Occultella kanbiaonis]
MARGRAEEFVLDFDEPGPVHDGGADAPGRAERRRKIRGVPRPLVLWAAVSVVLVVAGVLTMPPPPPGPNWGVGPSWSSPPVEQWTVPLESPTDELTELWIGADAVLVAGADRLDAYDRADGTVRWSVTDVQRCTVLDAGVDADADAVAQELAVCVSGSGADAGVAIIGTDGAVRQVVVPGAASASLHGEDLVVLTERAEAEYELTLYAGLEPSQVRWSASVEFPALPAGADLAGDQTPRVRVLAGDRVLLNTGGLYSAATGEKVPGSWSASTGEGALVSWEGERTRLILPGTDEVLEWPGLGWLSVIDDGSSPALIIRVSETDGSSIEAVTWDGDVLWRGAQRWPVARFGDILLLSGPDTGAIRASTGTELWSIPDQLTCPCRGDASGLLVYALDYGPASLIGARLIGLRPADGEVLWEIPLDEGVLVADTDEAIAVLVDGQLTLYSRT